MGIHAGLSYGGALLVPQRSPVDNRSDVDLSTNVTPDLRLDTLLVNAAIDTVAEAELAGMLSGLDGLGVVHRFLDMDKQTEQIRRVAEAGRTVADAVGINEDYLDRTEALLDAGADAVAMDIVHGHIELCLDAVERTRDEFDPEIAASNVVTPATVEDLREIGAGCVKVGTGPGSHCTTREVAGADYPQLTVVSECAERAHDLGTHTMTDGGTRTSDDTAKVLVTGADTVIIGSFFAGTDKALGWAVGVDGKTYKRSRGVASTEAANNREDKQNDVDADEGIEALTPYKGPIKPLVKEFPDGVRPGVSCCGDHTLMDAHKKASFIRVAASAKERKGAHGVVFAEGPIEVDEKAERELQAPITD